MDAAQAVINHCQTIATYSEVSGQITRTFLSPLMRDVHDYLQSWMRRLGMKTRIDRAGNLSGTYGEGPVLLIGSHLDTVPNAGAYDGILGVVLGIMLVELLEGQKLPYAIEVIGFSEEEGVRFGVPFIGSRAFIGDDSLIKRPDIASAIHAYGLQADQAAPRSYEAYLEFHIEQGPVLESLNLPLGIVEAIAGQTRLDVTFTGQANHAGTTPMSLRRDALAAAAEWILAVETGGPEKGVATVGHLELEPNTSNAINGHVLASLDVRHADDAVRLATVDRLLVTAHQIANRRNIHLGTKLNLDQAAVPMDTRLTEQLATAAGPSTHRMTSGAGHDAMIVAPHIPAAMLFLRSPGGISHHPDESVLRDDVAAALDVGMRFLKAFHV